MSSFLLSLDFIGEFTNFLCLLLFENWNLGLTFVRVRVKRKSQTVKTGIFFNGGSHSESNHQDGAQRYLLSGCVAVSFAKCNREAIIASRG